jgi:hypothetical protein
MCENIDNVKDNFQPRDCDVEDVKVEERDRDDEISNAPSKDTFYSPSVVGGLDVMFTPSPEHDDIDVVEDPDLMYDVTGSPICVDDEITPLGKVRTLDSEHADTTSAKRPRTEASGSGGSAASASSTTVVPPPAPGATRPEAAPTIRSWRCQQCYGVRLTSYNSFMNMMTCGACQGMCLLDENQIPYSIIKKTAPVGECRLCRVRYHPTDVLKYQRICPNLQKDGLHGGVGLTDETIEPIVHDGRVKLEDYNEKILKMIKDDASRLAARELPPVPPPSDLAGGPSCPCSSRSG